MQMCLTSINSNWNRFQLHWIYSFSTDLVLAVEIVFLFVNTTNRCVSLLYQYFSKYC